MDASHPTVKNMTVPEQARALLALQANKDAEAHLSAAKEGMLSVKVALAGSQTIKVTDD